MCFPHIDFDVEVWVRMDDTNLKGAGKKAYHLLSWYRREHVLLMYRVKLCSHFQLEHENLRDSPNSSAHYLQAHENRRESGSWNIHFQKTQGMYLSRLLWGNRSYSFF